MDVVLVASVGLLGLYEISKNKNKEGFTTNNKSDTKNIDKDYLQFKKSITTNNNGIIDRGSNRDPPLLYREVQNKVDQTTDKIFKPGLNVENTNDISTELLTGENVDISHFSHNNMVPYFGSKIPNVPSLNNSGMILDHKNGNGSQMINKKEQAPLFEPKKNMQWTHGTPNMNDFFKERQTQALKMNNVKPWQEIKVAPGLNQGYTTDGSGGFNSGMGARTDWLPKTVDQLRVDTNPKQTYELNNHQGPAQSNVKNLGNIGTVEKHLPDTYYLNNPDRYLVTTGEQIKPTAQSIQELGHVSRPDTSVEYYGDINGKPGSRPDEHYCALNKKPHIYTSTQGDAYTNGQSAPNANDYGANSYQYLPNNRNTTKQVNSYGNFGSAIGSVVAPVLDILRPSRKENTIGNIRSSGNVQGGNREYFMNNDPVKTTIKQTTLSANDRFNIQMQNSDGYLISNEKISSNQRDSTNVENWANPNKNNVGVAPVLAYDNQQNNDKKQTMEYFPNGSDPVFNNTVNVNLSNKPVCNNRDYVPSNLPRSIPSIQTFGNISNEPCHQSAELSNRLDGNLLQAFKENPYTQSLESY